MLMLEKVSSLGVRIIGGRPLFLLLEFFKIPPGDDGIIRMLLGIEESIQKVVESASS